MCTITLAAADKVENATIQFGETFDVNFAWQKVQTAWIKNPIVFAGPATASSADPCVVQVRAPFPLNIVAASVAYCA